MRITTQKILALLHFSDQEECRRIGVHTLRECLPELTDGGFRSLIHLLETQELITTVKIHTHKVVMGTRTGARAIEAVFPWIKRSLGVEAQQASEPVLLIFRKPSTADSDFRVLRRRLQKEKAIQLARGVYLLESGVSPSLELVVSSTYRTHLYMCRVQQWLQGEYQSVPANGATISDIYVSLSSISSRLDRLIADDKGNQKLIDQQKKQFFSLYEQFASLFGEYGVVHWQYLPSELQPVMVLKNFQHVISSLE